jgi:hypothetical protein
MPIGKISMSTLLGALWIVATGHAEEAARKAPVPPRDNQPVEAASAGSAGDLPNGLHIAEWDAFAYELSEPTTDLEFNLEFTLQSRPDVEHPRARVIFNLQDSLNYYLAEFRRDAVHLARVEAGIEQPIGTSSPFGLSPGKPALATIKRRAWSIVVALDGRLAARAVDDTFSRGRAGSGSMDGSVAVRNARWQPRGDLYFADDFMRASGNAGVWETLEGTWDVAALDNPVRSVNAFSCVVRNARRPAVTVTGHRFWDNYHFRTAAKPKARGELGLVFNHMDPDNSFRFTCPTEDVPEGDRKMRIVRIHHGVASTLAERPCRGLSLNQWYSLDVEALDGTIRASVDESPVLDLHDPYALGGKVGLFAHTRGEAVFDDVVVEPTDRFADDFSAPSPGTWVTLGGTWGVDTNGLPAFADPGDAVYRVDARAEARAVTGRSTWDRYEFEAEIAPWATGSAGLVFAYLDESHYGLLRLTSGAAPEAQLVRRLDAKETVLARADVPGLGTKRARATVTVSGGGLSASLDGRLILEAWDPLLATGRAGVYAAGTGAAFDNVAARFRKENPEPVFTVNQVFATESPMSNWAAAQNDWLHVKESVGGTEREIRWHRASFPLDVEVWVTLDIAAKEKGSLSLYIGAEDERAATGYEVTLNAQNGWLVRLLRKGTPVAEASLPPGTSVGLVRLKREGSFLVAVVGEVPVIAWKDPASLTGQKLGWWAQNLAVRNESVDVYSSHVLADNFTKADSQWRAGGGTWQVSRRWQCDPRWSFFSGTCDEGPAALWHKRYFRGDLTVEFCAAVKMDFTKAVGYAYASDLNLTICADGQDLDSGYSFVFGGWKNTRTAIVRRRQVVAQSDKLLLTGDIHTHWWHFRVEKRGGRFRYYVDNALALEYTDPDPLAGDRIALWTYRHGMMLTRFRTASPEAMPMESPETAYRPGTRCFYDPETDRK